MPIVALQPRVLLALAAISFQAISATAEPNPTFCNPLNLDYRFQLDQPSRREAADPAVVYFDNEYWLFASKSGGYWHSPDFQHWTYVAVHSLPIEDYAPAPAVINRQLYYTAFNSGAIFCAVNPRTGQWTKVGKLKLYPDPDLFQDDDGKVYVYYGCSPNGGIAGVELDPAHGFTEVGKPVECLHCSPAKRGWEVPGDSNTGGADGKVGDSWIEGAWMTKNQGVYYLQYSAPGTQFHGYADGVFTSESPLGPFTYYAGSPFSHKPTGFITGAGHSCTFQDAVGQWWHISTSVISVRHMFERRVSVYPAGFSEDDQLFCNTYLGDYPQFVPGTRYSTTNHSPGWMLLSLAKNVTSSSTLPGHPAGNAVDENIQTWWSAETGNPGEWLKIDLGAVAQIFALQINFADEGATAIGKVNDAYQYYVEASNDGVTWKKIVDRSSNHQDAPHDYIELPHAIHARYLQLVNVHCVGGAKFSVSGFRVFGLAAMKSPAPVTDFSVQRDANDRRHAIVSWSPSVGAEFYIVRYGLTAKQLVNNYQIYHATEARINALNADTEYDFTIDAVNARGVTAGKTFHHLQ